MKNINNYRHVYNHQRPVTITFGHSPYPLSQYNYPQPLKKYEHIVTQNNQRIQSKNYKKLQQHKPRFKPLKRMQQKKNQSEENKVYTSIIAEQIQNLEQKKFNDKMCGLANNVSYNITYDEEPKIRLFGNCCS